uniref:ATP synthase peripheral stalk subunit F6, mitochondrial n=1 Tax=Scophthalmus maximus TaxID=52904 RepID=A0A8D3B5H1_SCOMX
SLDRRLSCCMSKVFSTSSDVNCHLLMNTAPMDPIQKLFLDSIREYSSKSQASGGLVDAGSAYDKALAEEIAKLQRLYGGGDLESFPVFKFTGESNIYTPCKQPNT